MQMKLPTFLYRSPEKKVVKFDTDPIFYIFDLQMIKTNKKFSFSPEN